MFFKTDKECSELARFLGFDPEALAKQQFPPSTSPNVIRLSIEDSRRAAYVLAKRLVSWLGPFRGCLLWVTEYGIWPSSENRHLYYRLRASYGDLRELQAAPGHEFLDYETADLVTFVDLVIQFGWGAYLLPIVGQACIFISHDGWVQVESESDKDRILSDIQTLGLPYELA